MDNMSAHEDGVVEKKKSFIKPLLIVLLVLVLAGILGYTFFSFKDRPLDFLNRKSNDVVVTSGSETAPSPFGGLVDESSFTIIEDGGLVKTHRIGYDERVGLPKNKDGLVDIYYVNIVSSGDVYTKDITTDGGDEIRLFILKGTLENNNEVEALVGASFLNDPAKLSNSWLWDLLGDSDISNISDINSLLDESRLESIFVEDSTLRYDFYFDNKINASAEYRKVIDSIYAEKNPADIITDLSEKGSIDVVLVPF